MKRLGLVLATFVFSVFSVSLYADGSKIGVVDVQRVMQTSSQIKEIQQKLETEFKPRRDKLVATEAKIKEDMEKFKRDSTVLSANQKKEMERKIITAQQQFERDGQQYQQELSTANNEAMERLYNKIRTAIAKVAKEEKYDLIIQKDAAPFSSEVLDITDKVAKAVN